MLKVERQWLINYLLTIWIQGGNETIALADDGGVLAPTDGIHEPMSVVIVDHMNEAPPAPRHPLDQPLPKVVERHRYLHACIIRVAVAPPK